MVKQSNAKLYNDTLGFVSFNVTCIQQPVFFFELFDIVEQ